MHTRGRYSAADLSIVSPNGPRATLEPPAYFNAREIKEWRAIVDRLGPEYFPRDAIALLVSFVSISCQLEAISAELSKFKEPPRDEAKEYWELTRYRDQLVTVLASLSTKLRLAPSTRNDRDRTTVQARRAAQSGGRKPWEFGTDLDS